MKNTKNLFVLLAATLFLALSCSTSTRENGKTPTVPATVTGTWNYTGDKKIAAPTGGEYAIKSLTFDADGKSAKAILLNSDGSDKPEPLKYNYSQNHAGTDKPVIIFTADYMPGLTVAFTIEKSDAKNLYLKFFSNASTPGLPMGEDILTFAK